MNLFTLCPLCLCGESCCRGTGECSRDKGGGGGIPGRDGHGGFSIASSYRFTDAANRLLGGLRAVRRFVVREAAAAGGRPLEVLDVGCGACDLPLAVSAGRGGAGWTCGSPVWTATSGR